MKTFDEVIDHFFTYQPKTSSFDTIQAVEAANHASMLQTVADNPAAVGVIRDAIKQAIASYPPDEQEGIIPLSPRGVMMLGVGIAAAFLRVGQEMEK